METTNNFRNFFNDIDDLFFVIDLKGNIIEINNAVTSVLGYSKEDLLGKTVLNIHPYEFRKQADTIIKEIIDGTRNDCPIPFLKKDKSAISFETRIYQDILDNEKVLICVCKNLSDIVLSEAKFRDVFYYNQTMMVLTGFDSGLFIDINKEFLNTLGYTENEVIGKTSKDINLYKDYSQRVKITTKLNAGEIVEKEEVIILTKTGDPLYCFFNSQLISARTNKYLLTSIVNITHLIKKIEKELERNLQQEKLIADISQKLNSLSSISVSFTEILRLIGEHTNVSRVYIFEDSGDHKKASNTYEWCNVGVSSQKDELQDFSYDLYPSCKRLFEEQGKIFSPDVEELPEDFEKLLKPLGIKSILLFPLYVLGEYSGFIGFDENNENRIWDASEIELLRIISSIISNTYDRLRYQKQLNDKDAIFKMALENAEAGLWDWNMKTGEVYYNEIWCKMLGYDLSEIKPHISSWEKLVNPEDYPQIEQALNKHLSGKSKYYESVHRLLTKSGEWKWVFDKGRIIERDTNGNAIRAIGAHIDIDNQKKIENKLRIANATKDKMLSIIGHDLRGSVGNMMQISELISDNDDLDEDTRYELIESQKILSKSTFELLENLLNWARSNSEKIDYHPQLININNIINDSIEGIQFQANKKNINITTCFPEQINISADENMIKLIIRNLLSNSVKFTPQNGSIHIDLIVDPDFIGIKIEDTGVGISKDNIDKILSDDLYISTYGTENEKGTGLGLKLCKSFIAIHNGTFTIESEINKGSIFTFTLPR